MTIGFGPVSKLYCGAKMHEGFVAFENACSRANTNVFLTSLNFVHFYARYCWWRHFYDGLECVYVKYESHASTDVSCLINTWVFAG